MNYSPSFSSTTPGFVSGNLTSKSSTPFLLVPNRNRSSSSKKSRPKPSFPISNKSNAQQQPQQPQPAPAQPARVPVPSASTSTSLPQQFKPPAHKHAHHLHSIPPREKSTRSLILDHMLFLLGKARFAQARAELGMGGWHNAKRELLGAGSPPPSGDLGSEHESEGEGVEVVGFGLQGSDRRQNRPDTLNRAENADSNMAQSFKSRAEGLEKVLSAMLDQPPEPPAIGSLSISPTNSTLSSSPESSKPARLPNGVRLRLLLTSLVNDVFSRSEDEDDGASTSSGKSGHRQQQPQPQQQQQRSQRSRRNPTPQTISMPSPPPDSPMSIASILSSPQLSGGDVSMRSASPPGTPTTSQYNLPLPTHPAQIRPSTSGQPLPPSLTSLARISSFNSPPRAPSPTPTVRSISSSKGQNQNGSGGVPQLPTLPSLSSFDMPPPFEYGLSRSSDSQWSRNSCSSFASFAMESQFSQSSLSLPPVLDKSTPRNVKAAGRSKDLFNAGVQSFSSAHELPALSPVIPRSSHWAPSMSSVAGTSITGASIAGQSAYTRFSNASDVTVSTVATTIADSTPHSSSSSSSKRCPRHLITSCGCASDPSNPDFISPIGAGLSRTGPPLRRKPYTYVPVRFSSSSSNTNGKNGSGTRNGNASARVKKRKIKRSRMTDLLPRFLRLSALVAMELGREAGGGDDSDSESARGTNVGGGSSYGVAKPSRDWYALLAGLVTRAALEGYLMRGWRGVEGVEILCGLGGGFREIDATLPGGRGMDIWENDEMEYEWSEDGEDEDEDGWGSDGGDYDDEGENPAFEPDGLPGLVEAGKILFPLGSSNSYGDERGRREWEEWECEMGERASEFLNIPAYHASLASHLEELAMKYPPEPVERAALRFLESVARWRGRPELASFNKSSNPPASPAMSSTSTLSISSLVHPSSPPAPSIASTSSRIKGSIECYFIPPRQYSHSRFSSLRPPSSQRSDVSSGSAKGKNRWWKPSTPSIASSTANGGKRTRRGSWEYDDESVGSSGKSPRHGDERGVVEPSWTGPYGI